MWTIRLLTVLLLVVPGLTAADTFLIRSVDSGRTWTDIAAGLPDRFLHWVQVDAQSSTLYALTQRDLGDEWHLSVSADRGQTWNVRQTFPRTVYWMTATADQTPDTLYLAYEVGQPFHES